MRYSTLLGKTRREAPRVSSAGEALLLRAGLMRASVLLPLGARVTEKIVRILDEELEKRGAQRLFLPPVVEEEDALRHIAGGMSLSYRELPAMVSTLYWKGEKRWSLIHSSWAFGSELDPLLKEAYRVILERLGLAAEHAGDELVVLHDPGDTEVAVCDSCSYRALWSLAESRFPAFSQAEAPAAMEAKLGEGIINTAELASFLGIPIEKTTKMLLFQLPTVAGAAADGRSTRPAEQAGPRIVAVCVRGEFDVSEAKLAALLGCPQLQLAPGFTVRELTGAEVGYAGPLGLPANVEVIWDLSTEGRINFEAGANRTDYHYININFDRDLPRPTRFVDVRQARDGETCARCGARKLAKRAAICVARISSLGAVADASVAAKDGKNQPLLVASAAMDMIRLLGLLAARHCDDRGLAWPAELAPFAVHLVSLAGGEAGAEALYERLTQAGVETLWDDRAAGAGVKLGDADLLGIPVRLVLSSRTGEKVEWKLRQSPNAEMLSADDVLSRLA